MSGARLRLSKLMAANDNKDLASLKGLLFSDETHQIAELETQLASLNSRVGDDDHLTRSVANIVAAALRQAEVKGHRELSQAISPLVVASIRREIVDSRDVMVEALYPITGRLVSSYVSGAIQKLSQDINARFDALLSPRSLMLRMRAAFTGKSYGELMLAENAQFHVSQILLVEAQSGVCLARWPEQAKDGRSNVDMISALLTAIMDFSREAFADSNSELRSLNFGNLLLLLRRSPQYIVVAVGAGQVSPAVEQAVDEEFLTVLDSLGNGATQQVPLLEQLHDKIEALPQKQAQRKGRLSPALVIFSILALALLGFIGWNIWQGIEARKLAAKIDKIEHMPDLQGFPVFVQTSGERLRVNGIAPNQQARTDVQRMVENLFPGQPYDMAVATVPREQDMDDVHAAARNSDAKAAALEAALKQAQEQQAKLSAQIASLESQNLQNLNNLRAALSTKVDSQVQGVAAKVEDVTAKLQDNAKSTNEILAQKQAAFDSVVSGIRDVADHVRVLDAHVDGPEAQLRGWIGENALFFSDISTYRDPIKAQETLQKLAGLLKAAPRRKLRVVGYADDATASASLNRSISLKRAEHVATDLKALGVLPEQLILVSRANMIKLSENDGPSSSNRRVTFELVLDGE